MTTIAAVLSGATPGWIPDDRSWDLMPNPPAGEPTVAVLLILLVGEAEDWREQALCAQTDPEAFFPERGQSTREAKRVCAGCEVRSECLQYALDHEERFGIWGGLSERERRRERRRRATVTGASA